jgi:hypothetical protein
MLPNHSSVAEGPQTPASSLECRVYTRRTTELIASCHPVSAWGRKDSRWVANISDVSLGGIRLIVRRRFEPGSGLGIELPGRAGEEPYTVLAKVIHVQALPDGCWALGCKFISDLGEDELEHLLPSQDSALAQPTPETAPAPIVPSRHPQVIGPSSVRRDPAGKTTISEVHLQLALPRGRLVDCRIRHLTVPGSWPLAPGKTLAIRTNLPGTPLPLLELEVVRCWQQGDRWTLRCLLLNDPADNVLRALCPPVS